MTNIKKLVACFALSLACSGCLSVSGYAAENKDIPNPFADLKNNSANPGDPNAPSVAPMVIPAPPEVDATSWVLMDYDTGRVITEHQAHQKIWPASLTKMMTSYVIGTEIKAGRLHMDDNVEIPLDAWSKNYSDSSKMFIEVGKTIKVGDLVRGIIIQSGNDACVAMAIHLAGTEQGFVGVMNKYCEQLGLKETHFSNVHGLYDDNNYSTAYDMSLLGRALIKDLPEEYSIYSQKDFTFNGIKQHNRNQLLWDKTLNVDGIKTGHLSQIGYNLVASATEGPQRMIATVIGAKSEKGRAQACRSLLIYGFRYFEAYTPLKAGKTILSRAVRMGEKDSVDLVLPEDLKLLIPRGRQNQITINYKLKHSVFKAPIAKGENLGHIEVKIEGRPYATATLVSAEDIKEGGFFSKTWDQIISFFTDDDEATDAENTDNQANAG